MTTLIKKYFPASNDLEQYLNSRFNHQEEHSDKFKIIVKVGFQYDILNEPPPKQAIKGDTKERYIDWLYKKYLNGISNKSDVRVGKAMGTKPDKLVDLIVGTFLGLKEKELEDVSLKHRLSMQAENVIGNLLEEYLETELSKLGWVCCYGEVLEHSDLCHPDGFVLQVKNRDNTENNASKSIRNGRPYIKMWFRSYNKTGRTNWEKLSEILIEYNQDHTTVNLTEEGFLNFTKEIIGKNKRLLKF